MPPAGCLYLKFTPLSAEVSEDLLAEVPFSGALALVVAAPVFGFWRSRRLSSAFVLPFEFEAAGTAMDDLRCAGIADFGVRGFVEV
jgi:hypothetical protein